MGIDMRLDMKRKFSKFKPTVESIPNPRERELVRTMVVLSIAAKIGPDVKGLVWVTGYSKALIEGFSERMREAGLWGDNWVDDREWREADPDPQLQGLCAHALVALGRAKRTRTFVGALYVDADSGNVIVKTRNYRRSKTRFR